MKANVDSDRQSLRGFLRLVETEYPDELLRIRQPVDLRLETTSLVFELDQAVPRPDEPRFVFLELVRDVTLGADERLAALVVGRDGGRVRRRDFDVVAEDPVVGDLQ